MNYKEKNHIQMKEAIIKEGAPVLWSVTGWGTSWDCGKNFWWGSKMVSLTGRKCDIVKRMTGDCFGTDLSPFHLHLIEWLLNNKSCSFSFKPHHLLAGVLLCKSTPILFGNTAWAKSDAHTSGALGEVKDNWGSLNKLDLYPALVNWDLIFYSLLLASS